MIFSKRLFSYFVLLTTLSSVIKAEEACCTTTTTCQNYSQNLWQPRAFSSYKTREMIALQEHLGKEQENVLSFAFEYMQDFGCGSERLGALPFWSGSNTMTIGTNDGKSDLDSYQFGLGEATKVGSITLNPEVRHVGGDILWRIVQHTDEPGAYFQVKLPLGAMMIETKVDETPATVRSVNANTLGQDGNWTRYTVLSERYDTLEEALRSDFEHRNPDLLFGRLATGRNTVIRCGDIEVAAGYNFVEDEKGHFGVGFKFSAPTGNVPNAKYILEPVFGRAGHWGVGAEFNGNYRVYENDDMSLHLSMRADVLHLTSGRTPHWRSLDLALNGPGSKYLLVQHYTPAVVTSTMMGMTFGQEVFSGSNILPAINITTVPVLSKFSVEGSFALGLTAQKDNWNMSLIGEFWGRARECLRIDYESLSRYKEEDLNNYAVLGRQIQTNYAGGGGGMTSENLYYCEPLATINKSEDRRLTYSGTTFSGVYTDKIKDARLASNRIPSDHSVALDLAGAQAPRALTGKITLEGGYTWMDSELSPHLSVFGGVEFADKRSRFPRLWSVGVQGSVDF